MIRNSKAALLKFIFITSLNRRHNLNCHRICSKIMELDYQIQLYAWGKKGSASKVATLYANVNKDFEIDEETPYSELWIGTHVNGPSYLKTGPLLSDLIRERPEVLGLEVQKQFGRELPFLFKVLSVNQALSIQAHPSKEHAERLHAAQPNLYKDPNHKPELAIALTPFEALCGFRPYDELKYFLTNIPEFYELIPEKVSVKTGEELLKDAFRAILTASKEKIKVQLKKLLARFKNMDANLRHMQHADLIEKLYTFYPNDVGCFVVYFLNYLKLRPFEAIYLGANVPHAYLFGDCVECMACSDNVVRAGLTPKLIDVETLCQMLIYKFESPNEKLFDPHNESKTCQVFKPPVPDFAVAQIKFPVNAKKYKIPSRKSASTLLVISGAGKASAGNLIAGSAFFLPAEEVLHISEVTEDLLIYQAFANV